ncbi:MAG TPA: GNAT family N-acetyltransferase [Dongiaceae bacterium]|jgi:GNAT superfamily N-acetyltransferase|nr:GNAT family N-acetyltransferase [Dongiaceae bacterium]
MSNHSGFRIRPYGGRDLPAARAMLDGLQEYECTIEANRAHWADGGRAYAEWMLEEAAQNSGAVLVAESDAGAAIGLLTCWRAEDATDITVVPAARVHLYISELFVVEAWRGKGVAAALLAAADDHARGLGIAQVTIGSLASNAMARRAYAKAGFEEYEILLRKRV